MRIRLFVAAAALVCFAVGLVIGTTLLARDTAERDQTRAVQPTDTVPATTVPAQQPVISGTLTDGRPWVVREDVFHQWLCPIVGDEDFGCDDNVFGRGAPSEYPRKAVESNGFPTPQAGVLLYGYLPPDATSVVLDFSDGRTIATEVDRSRRRFRGVPITPGDNPSAVSYRTAQGVEIDRFPLG